ncbi:MAG: UDP-N-acetylglucosamine 2-epimerase (non-hydrolyzing) [Actinobacteria bacterium]|nr:UDP-N-acetylglucosamine 2-epimerase (non-hydrolyzing) [Actinomycetota bacterium]
MSAEASSRKVVLSVFGTRPEAIKMAPIVRELARFPEEIVSRVCVTAQHRGMLDEVLDLFEIRPDHDLDVMRPGQSPTKVAAAVLHGLEGVLGAERPDWVLVQGDTTTAAFGGLAAFYAGARVAHVEAGLRSHVAREPFPEELNRRVAAVVSDLHFAPTVRSRQNLLHEGIRDETIVVTGNSVVDALAMARRTARPAFVALAGLPPRARIVTVTAHRRESFGVPLLRICAAVRRLVARFPDVQVVFPVHPNPSVRPVVEAELGTLDRVTLTEPLDYRSMVELLERSTLVLTDSGGLQEEAPSLGKPVLVLRDVTERVEGVEAGTVRLVGTDADAIVEEAALLLASQSAYEAMSRRVNPYGDGLAAKRIVAVLRGRAIRDWPTAAARLEASRRGEAAFERVSARSAGRGRV